jgi:Zn-dependent protease with chaperone function
VVTPSLTSSSTSRPRLNPFSFPSDTDFRFVILIVAVLSASLFIYQNLYFAIPANSAINPVQCYRIAQAAHPTDPFALMSAYTTCTTSSDQIEALWIGLCIALLLSVAGIIYWAFPAWKMWRGGLEPLSAEHSSAEMLTCLSELCDKAGLTAVFLLNAFSSASSGLSFGRLGRYYVVLNSGLILRFQKDPAAFRAIVLHELGHIRNADVDKTYFTIAIGWAFALAALLPWAITQIFLQWNPVTFVNAGWRVLALAILIYLTIVSLLRTREVYADVRVAAWDGLVGTALRGILGANARPKGTFWQRLRRTHPEPEERCEVLDDPSRLFRLRFWMAYATGITVASAIINVELLSGLLHLGSATDRTVATGIIFAFLVVGVVGIAAWRTSFANLVYGQALPSMMRASAGLALGLLLGQTLSLIGTYTDSTSDYGYFTTIGFLAPGQFTLSSFLSQSGSLVFWSLLLLLVLYFFLRWVVVSATTWLAVVASNIWLRRSYWTGMIIAGIVLGMVFGQFYYLRTSTSLYAGSSNSAGLPDLLVVVIALIQSPYMLIVFNCLWIYPLVAWLWRKRSALPLQLSWALLDPPSQLESRPALPRYLAPLRPGLALLLGLGGGIAFLGLFSLFTNSLSLDNYYQTVLAVFLQLGMAAIVAAWVPRLGAIHGLLTAFVTGCIAAFVMLAYRHTFDGTTLISVVNAGMLAALPVVLLVSTIAKWVRHLSQQHGSLSAMHLLGAAGAL